MNFFRSYIAPLIVVLVFLVALGAASARIFLPDDMMAPAPIDGMETGALATPTVSVAMDSLKVFTLDVG